MFGSSFYPIPVSGESHSFSRLGFRDFENEGEYEFEDDLIALPHPFFRRLAPSPFRRLGAFCGCGSAALRPPVQKSISPCSCPDLRSEELAPMVV
jgi:hypothetical protein